MSTRATYQIDYTTFYVHTDGYPTGAADKFRDVLSYIAAGKDHAINFTFADIFLRALDNAEITQSHDAHGDTEYRYTVTTDEGQWEGDINMRGRGLDVLKIKVESVGWSQKEGETLFEGPLMEFIETAQQIENVGNE